MKLKILGSGSSGNCYFLENDNECLILDVGIPYKGVLKALNFNISKVVGVFASHTHKDHLLAIDDFKKYGVPTFTPYVGGKQSMKLGGFTLNAFPLPHDGTENRGLMIQHKDIGTMLYMTDMEYCRYTFKSFNVSHLLIEANYDKQYVSDMVLSKREHVLKGHCEIETTLRIIEANKTDSLKNVILCHLSKQNSNNELFCTKARKVAGCNVFVDYADKNKEWIL